MNVIFRCELNCPGTSKVMQRNDCKYYIFIKFVHAFDVLSSVGKLLLNSIPTDRSIHPTWCHRANCVRNGPDTKSHLSIWAHQTDCRASNDRSNSGRVENDNRTDTAPRRLANFLSRALWRKSLKRTTRHHSGWGSALPRTWEGRKRIGRGEKFLSPPPTPPLLSSSSLAPAPPLCATFIFALIVVQKWMT